MDIPALRTDLSRFSIISTKLLILDFWSIYILEYKEEDKYLNSVLP